jgi:micrococcal nuclease
MATLALLASSAVYAADPWRTCRFVIDGDTLVVSGVGKVRLLGVDTPELAREGRPAERGAVRAKDFVRERVEGQPVRLEYDVERHDKYGRTLAYVYLKDGTLLNELLVRRCLGEPIRFFPYRMKEKFFELAKESCGKR